MFFSSVFTFLFFNYTFFILLFLYIPFLYFVPRLMCHSFTFLYSFFLCLPSRTLSFLFRFFNTSILFCRFYFFVSYNSLILTSVVYCLKSWISLQTIGLKPLLPIFRVERVKVLLSKM